jgi:hypothetical protein
MRKLIFIPLLALICAPAIAQRGFSGAHIGSHFGGRFSSPRGSQYFPGYTSLPLFWDSFYPDGLLDSGYPVAAVPSFIVIQQPSPQAAVPVHQPEQPLLIELRGGRYVRVDDRQSNDQQGSDPQNTGVPLPRSDENVPPVSTVPTPSLPTVLVFRDGSRQQISGYMMADGVLYAQTNYYTDGSWNKKIPLSSLDLSLTARENHARGVPFQLPAAPNQVIVGP